MILLTVWITLPDVTTVKVGELACTEADEEGSFESEFAYAEDWQKHPKKFALDPISMPVGQGRFRGKNLYPPLSVFEDALPDDWGRALIIRSRNLLRSEQGEPHLLLELADHGLGLGALAFSRTSGLPVPRRSTATDLVALFAAAERFEAGEDGSPEDLQKLFAAGSSPGGARPKVLVRDTTGEWIAKFPSSQRDGRFDVVGLEAVGLDLAAAAGIAVPDHKLVRLGRSRQRALLVRRFDVAPGNGRYHMISLRTLCRELPGIYVQSYTGVAQAVRRASVAPQHDVSRLFKQMVFNAAFGNTDDHLKNFWMIHTTGGYRLSEAFDLVPDIGGRREHVLAFEYERRAPTRTELMNVARQWGVEDAPTIIDAVLASTAAFDATARRYTVPEANITEIGADLLRRADLLAG